MRELRDESWRARASDSIGSVQARTVGITALEWIGRWPTRHRPIARVWNGSSLRVLKNGNCLDAYELLNSSARRIVRITPKKNLMIAKLPEISDKSEEIRFLGLWDCDSAVTATLGHLTSELWSW